MPGRAEYQALLAKVDAFAERVQSGQGEWLACGSGCSQCCRLDRTAWAVELDHIRDFLKTLSADRLDGLRARLDDSEVQAGKRCIFLDGDERCAIYPARPLICRTHGPAVRLPTADIVWCDLNFTELDDASVLAKIAEDSILDVELLNRTLSLINQLYLSESSEPPRGPLRSTLKTEM